MDIQSVESIMRLHQQLAEHLPENVSGIVTSREKPTIPSKEVELMRSFLKERVQAVSETRDRAIARFDSEIAALNQAISDVVKRGGGVKAVVVEKPQRAKPAGGRSTKGSRKR
jgi:hypothetical protein